MALSVSIPRKSLAGALAILARVGDRKSTLPILGNVCVRVFDDCTVLAATDLNLWMSLTAPAWGGTTGGYTVPCKQLAEIVKSAPGDTVELVHSGPALRVASGGVDTTLIGHPDRDFPKIPTIGADAYSAVDGAKLASLLQRVLFSVCKDETRFHLNGVLLESNGARIRAISTDGHRLTLAQEDTAGPAFLNGSGVIVPTKSAAEIAKLLTSEKGGACSMAVDFPNVKPEAFNEDLAELRRVATAVLSAENGDHHV